MNFSAGKARRKWPCGGLGCTEAANGYRRGRAADALRANRTRCGGAKGPAPGRRGPRATCSGRAGRSCAGPRSRHRCRCRSRVRRMRPAAEPEKPAAGKQAPAETDKPAEQAAPAPPPPSACRLALTGRDRDCPQHSRHPWRRRLRRRGSGAAGGRGAAGQAAGFGETRGDPALRHGVGDRGLDPHRHGAAGGKPRQRHQRSRQFRLVRMPRPQPRGRRANCPSTAAPTRSTFAP